MENGEKCLAKIFDILEFIARSSDPVTVQEIARQLQLPDSTVYRIVKYLVRRNYAEHLPQGILLGSACLRLGEAVQEQDFLRRLAHPELKQLALETRETVHLAKITGNTVVYIDKCDGLRSIRMRSMIGCNAPLHCTGIGKALLASLPDKELGNTLRKITFEKFTENTLTSPQALLQDLMETRQRGYAIDDCEHENGVFCIAAAIQDKRGRPVAALSIAGLSINMKDTILPLAQKACAAAQRISEKL